MSRNLSLAAKQSLFAQVTDVVWLFLLKIDHASMANPIRVVNNTEDVVSNWEDGSTDQTFQAFPFRINLPPEQEDRPPTVQLQIDNVDRQVVQAVRELQGAPTVSLVVVTDNDYNAVEIGPMEFTLEKVNYDSLVVQGELAFEPVLNEPYPNGKFDPANFPGLF